MLVRSDPLSWMSDAVAKFRPATDLRLPLGIGLAVIAGVSVVLWLALFRLIALIF